MTISIPSDISIGSIHSSKTSGFFSIKTYINSRNVVVKFLDTGHEVTSNVGNIRRGNIKDPLFKSVLGVGFVGVGSFPAIVSRGYDAWRCMLMRCYSGKFHSSEPSYADCTVCEEWHNYQNFAKWHEENYPKDGITYALDKDLIDIGNKVYSPDKCVYVTQEVNSITTDMHRARGDMMIGVDFISKKNLFRSRCSHGSKSICLGYFNDQESAHEAWRKSKSNYAIKLSLSQSNDIVRESLVNYSIAIDNRTIYKDGYVK